MDYVISPVVTEKTTLMMEKENKLTFIVDRRGRKKDIKKEIEERFDVKVIGLNILITKKGKKAIAKLSDDYSAEEIGGRIGIF
ncbi:50S ribosomal protein L23 [Ferroplasma acidiphilum]|jgi:large subunit ribosomal protein L23|uniref:Large ribosomal subunit protein uL23 n=2 Tax=Ferroplasma TaxID=74968 RepID=S0AQ96_FERAC|nr:MULTISPECIES: 50S ribosomal protein L23 [Ferroplasma]MCL4348743.1 50S ribosomal protein L23 [Candidatus Thermoplasmatota archaeon]AGO61116.1 50S ribosomal protein L23 [Ferroplasma acidarmanus Fer1]ARD84090.1 50S ribosomal protein L23P [Ferroplasma acidiphilum]NOL59649.1 50S ribosomal protein L23 [Ferroplasma acidiphilum]WMT52990.1 MAG: 50S ribosomal protein L23 [Ferroplasma acidiphilum]